MTEDRRAKATVRSAVPGLVWPAVPSDEHATVFAILFQLGESQWWSAEDIEALQRRQLESLIRHAAREVPFYRNRLAGLAALSPGDLTFEAWRRLPVLERAEIQERAADLVARGLPREHGRRLGYVTSGSVGRPIRVQGTVLGQQYRRAVKLRSSLWHGRDFAGKLAVIQRLNDAIRRSMAAPGKLNWAVGHETGPMIHRDIEGAIDDHLDWLAECNPDYLLTYTTFARELARRAAERKCAVPGLRAVETMGEVMTPEVREAVRRAWDVPVVDMYAAQEVGPIALQCPSSEHYHVQAETILVEVVDDDGRPVPPGGEGRVVVTPLHNFAMPLLRYAIGDHAVMGEPCACGRGLPVLDRILGRTRNMVVLPSGERAWARISGTPFIEIAPLRQIQIVQRSLETVDVNLVAIRPLDAVEERRLRGVLTEALGHPFVFRLRYVDEIPRSPGGKFEDFRSELDVRAAASSA